MGPYFNKDFYRYIPKWMEKKLETILERYSREGWFEAAWDSYRDMCMSMPLRSIPDPTVFFNNARSEEVLVASDTEDDMGEVLTAAEEKDIPEDVEAEEMFMDGEIVRTAEEFNLDIPDEPSTEEFTFVGTCEPDERH